MLKLLLHADIRTMNAAMPRAGAAVVENGRFAFVGTAEGARRYLAGRPHETVDAQGMTVIPGLNDAHMHYLHTAMRGASVELAGARSPAEVAERLRAGLARHREGWLIGEGWNQETFDCPRLITREDLDAVSMEVPIMASRACGHIIAVNSRAMAIAGVEVADGIFREDEQAVIRQHIPVPDSQHLVRVMCDAQHRLFAQGITSVQSDDLGSIPPFQRESFLTALRDATEAGMLKVRYAQQALVDDAEDMRGFLRAGLHRIRGSRFRVSHMKILADGSLGARTAWMRSPYADAPDTTGFGIYDNAAMEAMVREAAAHDMPVAVHVIGDAATQQALDAIERAGRGLRHALVHAQIMDAEQAVRCGRLGLCVLAQPIFLDADAPIVRSRVGDALADTSYRWHTMLGAGAHVAFSTDCPVEPFDTMPNLYCAVTRKSQRQNAPYLPEEAFALEEALCAYSAAGAFASGEEGEKGQVKPGHLADFVMLNQKLDEKTPAQLLETGVAQTYIGGDVVYSS